MIAVLIKTSPKRRSLQWVLSALELQFTESEYRIYLYDEAPLDPWKELLYEQLRAAGHVVEISPSAISVGVARNKMIDRMCDEDFVLRMDDDFELAGEFSFGPLLKILELPEIDFCSCVERQIGYGRVTPSGATRIQAGFIHFAKGRYRPEIELRPDKGWKYNTYDGIRYASAEYMRNLILIKRHCFEKVRWNENLNFEGEHYDFYMSLKKAGFTGAFTPDSTYLHRDDLKHLCLDMEVEKVWRGDPNGVERQLFRSVFEKTWGGIPPATLRRSWPVRQIRYIKRFLNL